MGTDAKNSFEIGVSVPKLGKMPSHWSVRDNKRKELLKEKHSGSLQLSGCEPEPRTTGQKIVDLSGL
jgi:hypothetical protein